MKSPGCPELLIWISLEICVGRLSLRFGASHCSNSCRGRCFFAACATDARSLTLQVAQIVQACAANLALADHFNRADARRMQRKDALDADAEADAPHCKRCAGRPAFL